MIVNLNGRNNLGIFMETIRRKRGQTLTEMAETLKIAPPKLIAIEHGRFRPHPQLFETFIKEYELSVEELEQVKAIALEKRKDALRQNYCYNIISLDNLSADDRDMAMDLAKYISVLSPESKTAIKEIITKQIGRIKTKNDVFTKKLEEEIKQLNSLTDFRKFMEELRTQTGDTLTEMAKKIGISKATLSRAEHGVSKPQKKWIAIITREYNLSDDKQEELKELVSEATIIKKYNTKTPSAIKGLVLGDTDCFTNHISMKPDDLKTPLEPKSPQLSLVKNGSNQTPIR